MTIPLSRCCWHSQAVTVGTLVVTIGMAAPACTPNPPTRPVIKVAVFSGVIDQSLSGATTQRCQELRARLTSYLSLPGVRRLDASTLGTGDSATGFEPVSLTPWSRFERTPPKPFAPIVDSTEERDAWLNEQEATCQENLRSTKRSPVRQALERAVESLKAHCLELAQRGEQCSYQLLFISSDLREDVDSRIMTRLRSSVTGRGRQQHEVLPVIDTAGLNLTVSACGVSNYRGRETAAALLPIWHEVLPALSTVDAACALPAKVRTGGGRR